MDCFVAGERDKHGMRFNVATAAVPGGAAQQLGGTACGVFAALTQLHRVLHGTFATAADWDTGDGDRSKRTEAALRLAALDIVLTGRARWPARPSLALRLAAANVVAGDFIDQAAPGWWRAP